MDKMREALLNKLADAVFRNLSYEPETGRCIWLTPSYKRHVGDVAGRLTSSGYLVVSLCRRPVFLHRISWLLHTGVWPEHDIDHINGVRTDNRIANLRDVPRRINRENMRSAMLRNRSGLLGVRWHNRDRLWYAVIQANGVKKILGYRKDKHEAHALYVAAKRLLHEGCTI